MPRSDDATSGGEFSDQLGHHKEVDVGIVGGEVDEHHSGAAINPEILFKTFDDIDCLRLVQRQVDNVAALAAVGADDAPGVILGERIDLLPLKAGLVEDADLIGNLWKLNSQCKKIH